MRFLELRADEGIEPLRLHPRLTLVRGLDPAARVAIVGFLHSVATGDTFDFHGTVEVHGIEMGLVEALELAGETADAAQIIEASTLIEAANTAGVIDSEEATAHAEALAACEQLDGEAAELAEELSGASTLRSEMTARLATAAERLDPDAGRRLDRVDGELWRAARLADRPDPWTGMAEPEARVADLELLIETLDAQLAELPSGDRAVLAAAVGTARVSISTGDVPCPESTALAEAWLSLHQRLTGLESRIEASGGGTEAVAARLDAARTAYRAAEDAAVPRSVDESETRRLEELHDRVLDMEARAGRSIRRGAARKDFEEAQRDLNAALDDIGYPTWAAFRMGNGLASVSQAKLDEYERARVELEASEMEWAELMARLERETDLQSVLNAIDTALDHAVALLGHDPYVDTTEDDPSLLADALRARTIDAGSLPVDRDDAFEHLRSVLAESGCFGHTEVNSEPGLVALADTWLRALDAADTAAVRILRDRERAAAELKELILLGSGSRVDRLDGQRIAVHEAETEVAEHRAALIEVSQTRLELHILLATELAVAEEHDAKLELLEGARVLERIARHRLESLAGGPSGISAVAAAVPRGLAGPIPLVVLMGGAPMSALDAVLDLPADVQIIVLGDTDDMETWASGLPDGVADFIERSALV